MNDYTTDGACVIALLQQEIDYLKTKVASQEEQLVRIAQILEGDARDCKGEDKSIAGLVAERLDDEGQCVLAWTEKALKAEQERDEARKQARVFYQYVRDNCHVMLLGDAVKEHPWLEED